MEEREYVYLFNASENHVIKELMVVNGKLVKLVTVSTMKMKYYDEEEEEYYPSDNEDHYMAANSVTPPELKDPQILEMMMDAYSPVKVAVKPVKQESPDVVFVVGIIKAKKNPTNLQQTFEKEG